ncbi:MAG: hemolysin family protein [Actinomycetota bacterium]|nr:hemolysin family protein [Actinomycetota bacterium]
MVGLAAVFLLVLGTAFFVAAEFSLVAVERSRLESLAASGSRRAKRALAMSRALSFHLSGAQLGVTLVSIMLGFIAEPTIAHIIEPALTGSLGNKTARGVSIAIALALATTLSMVAGELIPKKLVIARPVRAALALALPLRVFSLVFAPVIKLANGTANWLARRLGVEPQEELASVRSVEELELVFRTANEEGELPTPSLALLTRSVRFGEKTVADVLVPRVDIEALALDDTVSDLASRAVETGHSRFPVYGVDLDDIVGVVHVKNVFALQAEARRTTPVNEIMAEPFVIPETRDLESLLSELRAVGTHLAVVVDEYGGTAGIVTVEDLLEEIVGEIDDEHDPASVPVTSAAGTWVLAGTLHHDEVLEACGFEMPDGEFETLAGFVLDRLGHIPTEGEVLTVDGWSFTVAEMDRHRVAVVRAATLRPRGASALTSAGGR